MSYELRLERMFDASPEVVFDAFVDPENQAELHGSGVEGWTLSRNETDVRVGGTSVYAMGVTGEPPDTETRVFSVVDRPHRLVFAHIDGYRGVGARRRDRDDDHVRGS